MKDNIKLLEELVTRAVDRLRSLTRERDEYRSRVAELQERIEAFEQTERGPETASELTRRDRQQRAVEELREALAELRGEKGAA